MSTIRLNEAKFNQLVSESVKKVLSELDWKTYANASKEARKRARNGENPQKNLKRSIEFNDMANSVFDAEYVGNLKYDTFGDKIRGKRSPKFSARFDATAGSRMPYGALKGYNKGGDEMFSTQRGSYHSSIGGTKPSQFFKNREVADQYEKANNELWDYAEGNYDYENGVGWKKKN